MSLSGEMGTDWILCGFWVYRPSTTVAMFDLLADDLISFSFLL